MKFANRRLRVAALTVLLSVLGVESAHAQATASPYTTGYRYDDMRRVVGVIRPASATDHISGPYLATRYTRDADGLVTKTETGSLSSWEAENVAPSAWTGTFSAVKTQVVSYDASGRSIDERTLGTSLALQHLVQMAYDANGRLSCSAIRMNIVSPPAAGADACTLAAAGSQGNDRITQNAYDDVGHLLQVKKAVGTLSAQAYGTYAYSTNGKMTTVIDANGNQMGLTYDGFDRQSTWVFSSKTGPSAFNSSTPATALSSAGALNASDYEQYTYDANNNRLSLRKRDGAIINYQYDGLNRVILKDIPSSTTTDVYYGYDLRGLQLYARFGSATGAGVTTAYDGFGRLTSRVNNTDGISRTLGYSYDFEGNRTYITHPDGIAFAYLFDGINRNIAICDGGTTCTTSSALVAIAYDTAGRRSSVTRGASVARSAYTYDDDSRPNSLSIDLDGTATTNDVAFGFAYTPADQMAARNINNGLYSATAQARNVSYTPNGLNEYGAIAGVTPTYDPNGNMTFDGSVTYGYDEENRLISATGGRTASLSYDPNGRLSVVTNTAVGGDTHLLYDGDELVAEYNSSGAIIARYVHGPGADEPLLSYSGAAVSAASRSYLFQNHQGSVVAGANSSGAKSYINTYDEYGVPNSANAGRFQYTGQIWVPQIAMYYYKARIYN